MNHQAWMVVGGVCILVLADRHTPGCGCLSIVGAAVIARES